MDTNTTDIITTITSLPGVTNARVWDNVPGKERIYIDTAKANGGRTWNGGVGYQTLYIDLNSKKLVASGEAGAATRKMLAETLDTLRDIAASI